MASDERDKSPVSLPTKAFISIESNVVYLGSVEDSDRLILSAQGRKEGNECIESISKNLLPFNHRACTSHNQRVEDTRGDRSPHTYRRLQSSLSRIRTL